jgi:OmpA-OmpF porin, OOP family
MIMAVEEADSYGGRDLYVSFLQSNGKWSTPLNMGPDVNTADEESAPYLAADDKTLYFSSKGYVGYGAMDIYVTRRLDDTWTKWSTPENLGPLINTERDDSFFNIPPTGEYGYFSRDFTRNNMDIFRFKLPDEHQPSPVVTIKGKVYNARNDQPMSAKIIYESLPDGRQVGSIDSDPQTGEFQILLPAGGMYGYTAEARDFITENASVDLTHVKDFQERTENLRLEPLVKGAVVRLNNVFFDFNKHELKPASIPELRRLMKIMDDNPNLKIQIAGHTDNVGRPEDNMVLSELRAKAVENYLVSNGVSTSRVSSVGFGQTRPIAPNDRELGGRDVNRRVEFVIVDK